MHLMRILQWLCMFLYYLYVWSSIPRIFVDCFVFSYFCTFRLFVFLYSVYSLCFCIFRIFVNLCIWCVFYSGCVFFCILRIFVFYSSCFCWILRIFVSWAHASSPCEPLNACVTVPHHSSEPRCCETSAAEWTGAPGQAYTKIWK